MEEILKVEGLTKTFKLSRKQRLQQKTDKSVLVAVDNLSFSVNKGEIFGLLGPNGAGKTTTMRMLATLISPDKGDAHICGESIVKNPEAVRKRIGFLTSELKLDNFFTPDYQFDFFAGIYGLTKERAQERKKELFSKFGITEFSHVKFGNLSTGMKQKVALVTSIVHDPDFIIFDEPTNGLDVITAKVVTDFLTELKSSGKTIILSTHIFSLVEKLCDRVGIIFDGKLAAMDELSALTKEKNLEDLFFNLYEQRHGEDL